MDESKIKSVKSKLKEYDRACDNAVKDANILDFKALSASIDENRRKLKEDVNGWTGVPSAGPAPQDAGPQPPQQQPEQQPEQQPQQQQPGAESPEQKKAERQQLVDVLLARAKKLEEEGKIPETLDALGEARKAAAEADDQEGKEKVEQKITEVREGVYRVVDEEVDKFLDSDPYFSSEMNQELIDLFVPRGETAGQVANSMNDTDMISRVEKRTILNIAGFLKLVEKDKEKQDRLKDRFLKQIDKRKDGLEGWLRMKVPVADWVKIFNEHALPMSDPEKEVYAFRRIQERLNGLKHMIASGDLPKIKMAS